MNASVLKVFKSLENAEGYVNGCINLDKASHYKVGKYTPSLSDPFLKKYVLTRNVSEYVYYEIWEEDVL